LEFQQNLWIVLVKPDFSSNTAEAYRLFDEFFANSLRSSRLREKYFRDSLIHKNPSDWEFYNDFLPVFLQNPEVNQTYRLILEQLSAQRADFVSLSGSGSTCFGVFNDSEQAQKACDYLKSTWNFTFVTKIKKNNFTCFLNN